MQDSNYPHRNDINTELERLRERDGNFSLTTEKDRAHAARLRAAEDAWTFAQWAARESLKDLNDNAAALLAKRAAVAAELIANVCKRDGNFSLATEKDRALLEAKHEALSEVAELTARAFRGPWTADAQLPDECPACGAPRSDDPHSHEFYCGAFIDHDPRRDAAGVVSFSPEDCEDRS